MIWGRWKFFEPDAMEVICISDGCESCSVADR